MEAIEQISIPHKINFENAKAALDKSIKPGLFQPPEAMSESMVTRVFERIIRRAEHIIPT